MTETRLEIKGPGLVRALQEATSNKKTFTFVYDHDNKGRLLRIGYFLQNKGEQIVTTPEITWFSPEEIQITAENTPKREFEKASLDIEFTHPKGNERQFLISLALDKETTIILRNIFRIYKNTVIGFVIQIEIRYISEGKQIKKQIVRYDHAHGFVHRDMIASSGEKTKFELEIQDRRGAMIFAIEEIRVKINDWLSSLGYTMIEKRILDQPKLDTEMEKAKNKLLYLFDNPKQMKNTQSTFVAFA